MKTAIIRGGQILGVLTALILLGACGSAAPSTSEATVTPLPTSENVRPAVPTSTPAPTAVALSMLPDVVQARQQLAEGKFEGAVSLLRRVYAANRNATEIQELLAMAYLDWGQATLANGAGDLAQVSLALDRFSSGLAVAPAGGAAQGNLQIEATLARDFLNAAQALSQLQAARAESNAADLRPNASELVAEFSRLSEQRADYPGLKEQHIAALLAAADLYTSSEGSAEEQVPLLQQALDYCEQVLALDAERAAAQECETRIASQIEALTQPTPTPRPTAAPAQLRISKKRDQDTPGCISMGIGGINTSGWTLAIDGLNLRGSFDPYGNVRICNLPGHDVTITVLDANGAGVPGGRGIPAKGGDIFVGQWR